MCLPETVLEVAIVRRQGSLAIDVAFALSAPWTVLFGPSGSGKTTVLRAIAGFVRPDAGRVVVGGVTVFDAGVFVAAHERRVRSAGQAARLFPGMTVRESLRYGMAAEDRGLEDKVLRIFRLSDLAEKRPEALSGGERQRVSVARAVISAAQAKALLLLDEPFSGMGLELRDELAVELRDWLAGHGVPVLSVTHDVGEVFLLGADVVRIESGCVIGQGAAGGVLRVERERLLERLGG
jgi:molybdate transport system ATP-binding protein